VPFQPMPLLNFELGLFKAKEAFIAPKNSFVKLENAHTTRGRLIKRRGYTEFGKLGIPVAAEVIGDSPTQNFTGTLANIPLQPGAPLDSATNTYSIQFVNAGSGQTINGYSDSAYPLTTHLYQSVTETVWSWVPTPPFQHFSHGSLTGVNNPRAPIVVTDGAQVCTAQYVKGTQYGTYPAAPRHQFTGDVQEPTGIINGNYWYPNVSPGVPGASPSGYIHLSLASPAGGSVTVTYEKYVGYVTNSTGAYDVTFESATSGGVGSIVCNYEYLAGRPVMGIRSFFTQTGTEYLVVCDTRRIWQYDTTEERLIDGIGSDTWAGDDSDFMQMQPYENLLYINNGVDEPEVYDPVGDTISDTGTDYDGDTTDDIKSAHLFLRHKSRGVYLNTNEGGSSIQYPQRARFTPVNDVEYAGASATIDYSDLAADAPTEDTIVSATFIGDDIIVLCKESVWRLRYSGDPFAPFEWDRIPSMDGAAARMGVVSLGKQAIWRGKHSMQISDGVSAIPFDFDIPDFSLEWNPDAALYTYGAYFPEERQVLFTYADAGVALPDKLLAVQLDEQRMSKSFSVFKPATGFHCFGTWRRNSTLTLDDVYQTWDSIEWTWDSVESSSSGFPMLLAGDASGVVYHYGDGYDDDGDDVTMVARSAKLNPFPYRRAHLGHVDIYADAVVGGSLTVYAYADSDSAPHAAATISLEPDATGSDKVRRRAVINKIANFHSIEIQVTSSLPCAIDEIVPYFKQAGAMRATG